MVSTLMIIQPTETKITGNSILENGKPVADASVKRIYDLIEHELVEIGRTDDGWSVLYLDKRDGRYWELNYPDSNQHGGGMPCLEMLSRDCAFQRYKISS